MAKLFQLGLFLNFVVIGMAVGISGSSFTKKRVFSIFFAYFFAYLLIGLIVLADVDFLVPEP